MTRRGGAALREFDVECPFCGENFTAFIDCSQAEQSYIEDCYVCCRPITFHVRCEEGELVSVETARE